MLTGETVRKLLLLSYQAPNNLSCLKMLDELCHQFISHHI
jgi:hypothetical protein